jgi:hypothetical protein
MSRVDRLVRERKKNAEKEARGLIERDRLRRANERAQLESQIRPLIPRILYLLERRALAEVEDITYTVLRVPVLGDLFGWRQVTRAAWKIGEWVPYWDSELHAEEMQPIWLVSNGHIGTPGRGGDIVEPVEEFGKRWPDLLPTILAGLRKREDELE